MADRLPFLQRLLLRAGNLALRPLELEIGSNLTLVDSGRGKATLSATGGGGGGSDTLTVFNGTGSTLTKGTAVRDDNDADASSAALKVAIASKSVGGTANLVLGLVTADIADGATGTVIKSGSLDGLDTHTFAVGDVVMVDTSSPVIGLNLVPFISFDVTIYRHQVGVVTKSDATTGSIFVDLQEFSPQQHDHTGTAEGGVLSGGGGTPDTLQATVYSAASLTKGTVVSADGALSGTISVVAASSNNPDPVFGVLAEDIPGGTGLCQRQGLISALDTGGMIANFSGYLQPDGSFSSNVSGLTYLKRVGWILVADATVGSLFVAPDPGIPVHGHYAPGQGGDLSFAVVDDVLQWNESGSSGASDAADHWYVRIDSTTHHVTRENSTVTVDIEILGTYTEITTPATPSAGFQTLFIDSADHKLKRKDSSGTVTIIG